MLVHIVTATIHKYKCISFLKKYIVQKMYYTKQNINLIKNYDFYLKRFSSYLYSQTNQVPGQEMKPLI